MTTPEIFPKAGPRQWGGLVVLCLPTMLATVDISVMILALPRISADLGASSVQQLWMIDIYGFMLAGFLITMGNLGDRVGRRKLLLVGAAAFIAASLFAAYSTSAAMLIGARALIGLAGATIMPSVLALIRGMFKDPRQMGTAMGAWGSAIMLGVIGGPVVAGALLGHFWWGSIFLISVPVMGLLLLTGPFLLPESRSQDTGRLDLISVAMSLAAILPVIYGVKELGRNGWGVLPAGAIVVGACFALIFLRRQRRLEHPLLDLSLFKIRALSVALMLALVTAMIMTGTTLTVTLFMQTVMSISPLAVGLWLLAPSIGQVVTGNMAIGIARSVRPGYVLAVGAALSIAGMLVIASVSRSTGMGILLTGVIMAYVGASPIGMICSFLIMSSAPPQRAGSAASLPSTAGELGAALGIAVMGVVATAVYRTDVTVPAGVSGGQASTAQGSIAGAVSTAGHLHGRVGADLLRSARQAYTSGLHVVAIVIAVLYLGIAFLSVAGLRHIAPIGARPAPVPEPVEAAQATD